MTHPSERPEETRGPLREALVDATNGVLAAPDDPTKLAGVLEVVLALADDLGVGCDQLERIRAAKAAERGGFAERIVWAGNVDTP